MRTGNQNRLLTAATLGLALMLAGCANTSGIRVISEPTQEISPVDEPMAMSRVVALAKQYDGLHERKNRKALKKVTGVDPIRTPWCAAFLNKLLEREGIKGTNSNRAISFLKWGKRTHRPKMGDIVVMRRHVGIFIGYSKDGQSVLVLGGNQDNSVRVSAYPKRKVVSYRTAT